jgi:nucleoside-diphosphate-sugar epimerase
LIAENAPQAPVTRKGRIRVEMEARLERAAERGVRGLVLRAGDFFGPGADGGALAWLVRRQKERITGVFAPGPAEVGHAFAYLPDLGEALGRLMEREAELAPFARFHFAGHWIATGDLARAIGAVAGRPDLRPTLFPWRLLAALSPFNETFRELGEMRYLWRRPIGLDGSSLAAFLGAEPRTPLPTALAATLLDMGLKLGAGESAGADAVLATA